VASLFATSRERAAGVRGFPTARGYPAPVPSFDIKRRMNDDDIAQVSELLEAAERADGSRPLSDHLWLDLRMGGREGFAGFIATEEGHEHIVGYSQISRGNDSWLVDMVVHPHHRYDTTLLGPQLMKIALQTVAAEGGGHVHWWVFEPNQFHRSLAENFGLHEGRTLLQMRRHLPLEPALAQLGDDLQTTSFSHDRDEEAWLVVNNAAFATHPEQGAWDAQTLRSRYHEPWFEDDCIRLHHIDGALAGFCWTKIHPHSDPLMGEIYVIAVHPDYVGRGLGTALTAAGLNHMANLGAEVAMLFVDADNSAALSSYERLGFTRHHRERAFVGDVPPSLMA